MTLAFGAFATPVLAKGDAAAGEVLSYTCTGCHGIVGQRNIYPHYHVPKIGGQTYDYLVIALKAYRDGSRAHPTMRAQGESLSDKDIEDIAAFLAEQTAN
jgi:cytochrome c553